LTGGDYEVGAGKQFTTVSSVPAVTGWKAGTIMRIWNTDTTGSSPSTFHEYFEVSQSGTPTQPMIVCGVPDASGNLPVLDGSNATGQSDISAIASAGQGIISTWPGGGSGGAYGYWQNGSAGPSYVTITGLHLRNATPGFSYTQPGGGSTRWQDGASCVNLRSGSYIDVSGNDMDTCADGFFTDDNSNNGWVTITQVITADGNHIHGSGWSTEDGDHQVYFQSYYGLMEGNRIDNYLKTAQGSNIKWRGVEGIFRYNYLSTGPTRDFDLVDNQDGGAYMTLEQYLDSSGLYGVGDRAGANIIAAYQESAQKDFVYGNLIYPSGHGSNGGDQQIHYSEDHDGGMTDRNGILYFYSNTMSGADVVFDTGTNGDGYNSYLQQRVDARNNIFWAEYPTGYPSSLALDSVQTLILSTTTNLFETNTISIVTPIVGGIYTQATADGWERGCDAGCPWPLSSPINTHLYGLGSANYLLTGTLPFDTTTLVPPNGSAANDAGTPMSIGNVLGGSAPATLLVRWQYSVTTSSLLPRTSPLTIGAEDPASGSTQPAATPTFNPPAGTYATAQSVTISSATPSATIYYTTDGTAPTTSSIVYSGAISVSSSETIKAMATASGYSTSAVGSAAYVITGSLSATATPTFSPVAGTYATPQSVTISTTTPSATIYYTTNGTAPTTSSAVYSGTISVSSSETIEAIATATGFSPSGVGSAAYVITGSVPAAATPTFTPVAGTYATAQSVTISSTTPSATIYYTTNGTAPTTSSAVYSSAISVSLSETIQAIATATGFSTSTVGSAAYIINAPAPNFSIGLSQPALTVSPAQSGIDTVTVTPVNGFSSAVSLSCSGLPAGTSCIFTSPTLTPSGAAASTTLTVNSTTTAALRKHSNPLLPVSALGLVFCCIGLKRRRATQLLLLAAVALGLGLCTGCNLGVWYNSQAAPQTALVTVTGTDGALQATATFTLTVQ
jgi:hypothetical protein